MHSKIGIVHGRIIKPAQDDVTPFSSLKKKKHSVFFVWIFFLWHRNILLSNGTHHELDNSKRRMDAGVKEKMNKKKRNANKKNVRQALNRKNCTITTVMIMMDVHRLHDNCDYSSGAKRNHFKQKKVVI